MPFSSPNIEAGEKRQGQQLLVPCVLGVSLVLLAMAAPLLAGRIYIADDLGAYHLPAREFYARCLGSGDAFDWWPNLYAGFYLTGEGQAGTYHPLHWALYRWMPLNVAFGLELLLSYPLLIAGTYVFLRTYIPREAALFGGMCFGFSGFALLHFMHTNAIAVVAHLPWLLWAIQLIAQSERLAARFAAVAAVGALTGSQLLLGYPQYVWFSLLAEAVYCILLLSIANEWKPRAWLIASVIAGTLLGLMLGGVQLLPTLDSLASSNRQQAPAEFATSGSLHPLNVLQLVAPYATSTRVIGQNTHELGLYFGAVPLMLITWGACYRAGSLNSRRFFWSSLVAGCVALLYAFGEHGPLYELQTWLPIAGKFRFSCRAIVLVHLSFAFASAVALSWLVACVNESQEVSVHMSKAVWMVAAASVLVAVLFTVRRDTFGGNLLLIGIGPLLVLLAAVLTYFATKKSGGAARHWAVIGLILFTAGDLGAYSLSYTVLPHTARLEDVSSMSTRLPADHARVALDLRSIHRPGVRIGNQMLLAGASRVDGYVGLEPQRSLDYYDVNALRLASTSHVLPGVVNDLDEGLQPHDSLWLAVPDPLPRVRLVTKVQESDNPAADLEHIDLRTTVLLDQDLSLPEGAPGIAEIESERPGQVRIAAQAPTRQVLVWAESFHSGWRASSNGDELQVYRAYGDFMACEVGPGSQEIEFAFDPQSLRDGKRLSLCGLGFLLCAVAISLAARRWSPKRFAS